MVVDVFSEINKYIHQICEYLPGDAVGEFVVHIIAWQQ